MSFEESSTYLFRDGGIEEKTDDPMLTQFWNSYKTLYSFILSSETEWVRLLNQKTSR